MSYSLLQYLAIPPNPTGVFSPGACIKIHCDDSALTDIAFDRRCTPKPWVAVLMSSQIFTEACWPGLTHTGQVFGCRLRVYFSEAVRMAAKLSVATTLRTRLWQRQRHLAPSEAEPVATIEGQRFESIGLVV